MTGICKKILLHFVIIISLYAITNCQDIPKLPYCGEDVKNTDLFFVSTIDGVLSAITLTGKVVWNLETNPGPLLNSNIHNLELTNKGQWIRIIPSLSGSLYKFDGVTIDAIPINADSILTSSFRYSDDLVIAGGRELRTYGVSLNSGEKLYECSLEGCKNTTDYSDDPGEIIIIERKMHTVRAVEPRTGLERWNFSVGEHNIKIPFVNCINSNVKNIDISISAVLPEGLIMAYNSSQSLEVLWQHKFETPIAAVWKWNGRDLKPIDLFSLQMVRAKNRADLPSIYLGMHNKQLYIHESLVMQNVLQLKQQSNSKNSVLESQGVAQIPWKPVPAASVTATRGYKDDDSTALSVLYASEYVNGNGYYLYTEDSTKCLSNITSSGVGSNHERMWVWWKEAFVLALTTIVLFNLLYNYKFLGFGGQTDSLSATNQYPKLDSNPESKSNEDNFVSRYMTEFEPICCLGKGGFGVVFQAKKKFDECNYAVKRITLPNKPAARDRMMREVKVLAKLDHRNIVRYYNAWLECPPAGWQKQHDLRWLSDFGHSYGDNSVTTRDYTNEKESLAINVESSGGTSSEFSIIHQTRRVESQNSSSSIVFEKNSTNSITELSNQDKTELTESVKNNKAFSPSIYLYIQMQLCCKESLKDWLINNSYRERYQTLDIFLQIVEAVEYVHYRGLIHRDLKPSNIFFSLEGQIKIGDFGLVTNVKEYADIEDDTSPAALERSYTDAVGTQLYMSPEQLNGLQYNYKVDIYSLGIIFFELLVAFSTEMERICTLTDLRNHTYPTDFKVSFENEYELLDAMLAVDSENRPNATGVRERLEKNRTPDGTSKFSSNLKVN